MALSQMSMCCSSALIWYQGSVGKRGLASSLEARLDSIANHAQAGGVSRGLVANSTALALGLIQILPSGPNPILNTGYGMNFPKRSPRLPHEVGMFGVIHHPTGNPDLYAVVRNLF